MKMYIFALLISNFLFTAFLAVKMASLLRSAKYTAFNSKLLQGCYFCALAISVFCHEMYEFPRENFLLRGSIHGGQWKVFLITT